MPTLCFIDTESGTNNSTPDALQVDDGSCSDVLENTAIKLKHSSNVCCTSSFYSEIVLPQDNYFMLKYTFDIGSLPELCIFFAFICITFHLHYI